MAFDPGDAPRHSLPLPQVPRSLIPSSRKSGGSEGVVSWGSEAHDMRSRVTSAEKESPRREDEEEEGGEDDTEIVVGIPPMSRPILQQMGLKELKAICEREGLVSTGKKQDLVQRLARE